MAYPRRPRGSESGREKRRDERTFSPNPTDCPWVSEAGVDGCILDHFWLISLIVLLEFLICLGSTAIKILTYIRSKLDLKMARHKITKIWRGDSYLVLIPL